MTEAEVHKAIAAALADPGYFYTARGAADRIAPLVMDIIKKAVAEIAETAIDQLIKEGDMKVWVLGIVNSDGLCLSAHATEAAAKGSLADYCMDNWESIDNPDGHGPITMLSQQEVIGLYLKDAAIKDLAEIEECEVTT